MVDHTIYDGYPSGLVAVDGHSPMAHRNANTGDNWLTCETCGWIGKAYRGRWADKADEQWRVHAGNLAMGVEVKHGEMDDCHCWYCRRKMTPEQARGVLTAPLGTPEDTDG